MRAIEFNYVCKHSYMGVNTFYSKTLTIDQIEASTDVIEDIGNEIDVSCNCINESCNHCECNTIFDYGDFEIVSKRQFTGLLDCNDVKIFEGDIVLITEIDEDSSSGAELTKEPVAVVWSNLQWMFDNRKYKVLGEKDWTDYATLSSYCRHNVDFKVIGNIHQNSELLK